MALLGKNPSQDQWLSCSNYVDEPQTNQYQEAPPALSNPPYRCGVEKDGKGHIVRKVEIVDGERTVTEYGYDADSRLVRVGVNGRQTEEYRYGDKGRRVYARLLQTSHGEAGRYPSGQSFKYRAGDRLGGVGLGLKLEYDHKGRTVHYHVGGPELSYNAVDIEYAELPGLQDMQTMLDLPMRLTYTEPRPEALRQKRAKFATDPRYGDRQTKSGLVESKRMTEKVVTYIYDKSAMRRSKRVDEQTVAHYAWLDPFRLEAIHAPWSKALVHFHYAGNVRLPYAATSGSKVLYLYYDHIGSLRVVANSNGDIVRKIEYESFGYIVHDTNPGLHLGYGFAGGLHDQDTGFVRFWVRDYDPKLGRFLSPDPAWAGEMTNRKAEGKARASAEVGKQVVDPDRYGYCLDDPINLADPTGMMSQRSVGSSRVGGDNRSGLNATQRPASMPSTGKARADGVYWTVHPKPQACERCQALKGRMFDAEPDRPHPNCKCEIRKHGQDKATESNRRVIFGLLQGYGGQNRHKFKADGEVMVRVWNLGVAVFPGVRISTNLGGEKGKHVLPARPETFIFKTTEMLGNEWDMSLILVGADNTVLMYHIYYDAC